MDDRLVSSCPHISASYLLPGSSHQHCDAAKTVRILVCGLIFMILSMGVGRRSPRGRTRDAIRRRISCSSHAIGRGVPAAPFKIRHLEPGCLRPSRFPFRGSLRQAPANHSAASGTVGSDRQTDGPDPQPAHMQGSDSDPTHTCAAQPQPKVPTPNPH